MHNKQKSKIEKYYTVVNIESAEYSKVSKNCHLHYTLLQLLASYLQLCAEKNTP